MKMVKTLLLGTAAGFVAVAGAQAADMPVKAAVAYVKICNLYGDGFYYLPGTNICVKIGGYVRAEMTYLEGSFPTNGPFQSGNLNSVTAAISNTGSNAWQNRFDGQDWTFISRAYISMDTREQTEYGVLRTYVNIGVNFTSPATNPAGVFNGNRAFIQFAGWTVGLAQSFYDFYCIPCSQIIGNTPASDTGDGGWKVWAYSVILGNGITATVSAEEPRRIGIINTNASANPFTFTGAAVASNDITGTAGADTVKIRFPDLVANLRIDQALYSAQVMFAAHDASAAYYYSNTAVGALGNAALGGVACPPGTLGTAASFSGSEICGHPADKLGYAAGAGFRINLPNTSGSYFQIQYNYTMGAAKYADQTQTGHWGYITGGTVGFGWMTDGIVNNATGTVDVTRVQGINAAFDYHNWLGGKLWSSIYGHWLNVSYDGIASASICATQAFYGIAGGAGTAAGITAPSNCANTFSVWGIGSRWQYNFTPAFYVGFDTLYQKLMTADNGGTVALTTTNVAVPATLYQVANQSQWQFRFRLHRDILP
jgi:Porin subfamily